MMFSGMNDSMLLIALGMGYVVLYLAKRGEKRLQFYGYLIGVVIIIMSVLYILSNIWLQANYYYYKPPRLIKKVMMHRTIHTPVTQAPQQPVQNP